MRLSDETNEFLNVLAKILFQCFVFNIALLLLWVYLIIFFGDFVFSWHARFFEISREQFYAAHYTAMAVYKIMIFGFLLLPLVAIKQVQWKARESVPK